MNNVSENPISKYFRPYPAYEDVFYDDIENHKKHFLPVCSVNLKFLFPECDEWVHFISAKQDNPGVYTSEYFTQFTNQFMYSFDIIDGKYKFETDWRYFEIVNRDKILEQREIIDEYLTVMKDFQSYAQSDNWIASKNCGKRLAGDLHELRSVYGQMADVSDRGGDISSYQSRIRSINYRYSDEYFDGFLATEYQEATDSFEMGKQFYQKYGHIYPRVLGLFKGSFSELEKEYHQYIVENPNFMDKLPEYFSFITDIKAQSKEAIRQNPEGFPTIHDIITPIHYNIWEHPMSKREQFEYIGCIEEYYFRRGGATVLNAFHDHEAKKASMLLDFD